MELFDSIWNGIVSLVQLGAVVYIVRTVYINKPSEMEITFRDFHIKSKR